MEKTEVAHKDILLALLAEYSTAMRERSQPEYLYTAAAVAGFGAVCWGVAALPSTDYQNRFWTHPDMAAIIGIVLSAAAMIYKIIVEHSNYTHFKMIRATVATQLKNIEGADKLIPADLVNAESGDGYFFSSCIIFASAFGSVIFILASLFRL